MRVLHYLKRLYAFAVFVLFGGVRAARLQGVKVGSGCRIYPFSLGSEPFLIEIGDRVTIAPGAVLLTHDGATCLVKRDGERMQRYGRIRIGSDVFVGRNAILMPDVVIGSRVVIGAGSVITRDVPDNSVVAGNPGRVLRSFDEYAAKVISACGPCDHAAGADYQEAIAGWLQRYGKGH